ncbi:MAG: TIM barrel protein [Chloroflexi bacterium]|nr:TIM barrel protein [Chloroflexota bacterium]
MTDDRPAPQDVPLPPRHSPPATQLGTAPDSWGVWFPDDPRQTPWRRFLDEVVTAGYHWIETGPYGYLPTDPSTLRPELERRGLRVAGGTFGAGLHRPNGLASAEEEARRVGESIDALGGGFLILLPAPYRDHAGAVVEPRDLDDAGWQRLTDGANRLGRFIQERFGGRLRMVVHPHADTHVETPEQVERFLDGTDPSFVSLCLDTGHYAYRFGDSADLMRRRSDRIPYLHIKTVDAGIRQRVAEEDLSFAEAVALGVCCEPQDGAIDFPAFTRQLEALGFDGFAIVEHDLYPCDPDVPLPIARRTRAYLRSIGLG